MPIFSQLKASTEMRGPNTIKADAKGGEALDLMLSIISVECYYTFLSFTSLIVSVMRMNEEEVKWKISRNS